MFGCGRAPEKEAVADADLSEPELPPALKKFDESRDPSLNLTKEDPNEPRRTKMTFMGTHGTGRRCCIIADHSLSLSPASLKQIKKEILATLRGLGDDTPFYVIFFAQVPLPMPADNWRQGKAEIDKVESWMANVNQKLGTLATPAFKRAMALRPRPDVVFLMTDGQLHGPTPAASIAALNNEAPKAVVHTILFTKKGEKVLEGPARTILEKIARDSGGEYRQYVPEASELPPAKKKKKN